MRIQTIGHEVEFTIRRDKGDVALLLELVQAHALMELDVLHLDQLASSRSVLHLKEHLVIEAKLQLRHAAQVAAHVNAPKDLRPEHISIRADQDVEPLDHIQEDLILGVLDSLRTPRDNIGGGGGHHDIGECLLLILALLFLAFHFVRFRLDVLLQDLDFSDLRVAVVHHLVEKLVRDDEVVPQGLVLKLAEVRLKHLLHLVQEGQHENYVRVAARNRHHIDVVDADPDEGCVAFGEDGLQVALVQLEHFALKSLRDA